MPRTRTYFAGCVLLLALAPLGCAGGSAPATGAPGEQLEFGVQMARRGLWNEALFRFEQAQKSNPGDPRLLNNLAVAYEAVGRYDEALATYQKAVRMAPGASQIRQNLSRFSQFYESFRPDEEGGEAGGAAAEAAPADAGATGSEPEPTPVQTPEQAPEQTPEQTPEQPPGQTAEPAPGQAPEEAG